jgi:hypothetical protein
LLFTVIWKFVILFSCRWIFKALEFSAYHYQVADFGNINNKPERQENKRLYRNKFNQVNYLMYSESRFHELIVESKTCKLIFNKIIMNNIREKSGWIHSKNCIIKIWHSSVSWRIWLVKLRYQANIDIFSFFWISIYKSFRKEIVSFSDLILFFEYIW